MSDYRVDHSRSQTVWPSSDRRHIDEIEFNYSLLDSLMQCLSLSDQVDYNLLHEHKWGMQVYVHSLCEYEVN